MFILDELETELTTKGRLFLKLDLSFDNVIQFYLMMDDEELSDLEKVTIGLELLVDNFNLIEDLPPNDLYDIWMEIVEKFLKDKDKKEEDDEEEKVRKEAEKNNKDFDQNESEEKKAFDFEVDGERIFASFMMDYKIDLFEQKGKMDFRKFMALLKGLSAESPLMKVIEIRTRKIPKRTKYNGEQVDEMRKLKKKYAIGKVDYNQNLNDIASILSASATPKEGDPNK